MSSRWHPGRSWPLGGTALAGCPPAATTLASLAVHLPHCSGLACPWAARLWVRLGATELLSQVSQPLYPLGLCPISTSLVPFRVYLGESCVGPSASPPLVTLQDQPWANLPDQPGLPVCTHSCPALSSSPAELCRPLGFSPSCLRACPGPWPLSKATGQSGKAPATFRCCRPISYLFVPYLKIPLLPPEAYAFLIHVAFSLKD